MHECKEKPDDERESKKGDFSWKQLVNLARDLFGNP